MKKTIGAVALVMLAMTGCTQGTEEPTPSPEPQKEKSTPEAEQADTGGEKLGWVEIDKCEGTGEFGPYGYEVAGTLTNNESEMADFLVSVELLDENGDRLADNMLLGGDKVKPGQSVKVDTFVANLDETDLPAGLTCNVYEVESLPSE